MCICAVLHPCGREQLPIMKMDACPPSAKIRRRKNNSKIEEIWFSCLNQNRDAECKKENDFKQTGLRRRKTRAWKMFFEELREFRNHLSTSKQ